MSEIKMTLPDNIEALKQIVELQSFELQSKTAELQNKSIEIERKDFLIGEFQQKIESLEQKFQYLQKLFFGRKSEKLSPEETGQGLLFNEAEIEAMTKDDNTENENNSEEDNKSSDEKITVERYERKKGRKAIPSDIPREEILHDLSEEDKKCSCCGNDRPVIGKSESEELDYVPAIVKVLKHVYPKYGPCTCEESFQSEQPEVISAPAEKRMIPGSIASNGLLSYLITSKFCDAIPFYRLSKMFARIDVDYSRATMCNNVISISNKMEIFMEVFKETLKSGNFIRMDETPVQVLHEEGREPSSKSYMWVAIGYPEKQRPLVLYEYHPSRAGEIPKDFLDGFKGYLQTDGYKGYCLAVRTHGLLHAGCFAHVRREFFKAYDASKKNDSRAYKVIQIIRKIYVIESDLRSRNLPDDIFVEKRKIAVMPILDDLRDYLVQIKDIVTPSSLTGQATSYALNEWTKLIRYLDLECMTPDNNEIEPSIKSFVIGRKNWLFSNSVSGANSSAVMYSLIESAKANHLNPYLYLRYIFAKIPYIFDNKVELRNLMPCFVKSEQLKF